MNQDTASSSNDPTLEQVIEYQIDRLDEMKKLDQDVITLNNAYIDILEQVSKKLDLLAMLADEVETDMRLYPLSMDAESRKIFDMVNQSALISRYMCAKGIFAEAIHAIQGMNQFGSTYISDKLVTTPPVVTPSAETAAPTDLIPPLVPECINENLEAAKEGESTETLASDSDATVAARLSDINVNEDVVREVVPAATPAADAADAAPASPPRDVVMPDSSNELAVVGSPALREEPAMVEEVHEITRKEDDDKAVSISNSLTSLLIDIPKDSPQCSSAMNSYSAESLLSNVSKSSEGRMSMADDVQSVHSDDGREKEEKKKKKKRKKRSKSSERRRRSREAEKMEHILNKHLKRSREKEGMSSQARSSKSKHTPAVSPSKGSKRIEVVTISDDEPPREVKKARLDESDDVGRGEVVRPIPGPATPQSTPGLATPSSVLGPMTPPHEHENDENRGSRRDAHEEIKSEDQDVFVCGSSPASPLMVPPSPVIVPSTTTSTTPTPTPQSISSTTPTPLPVSPLISTLPLQFHPSSTPLPIPPPLLSTPLPVPPPVLPFSLGCAPGFTRATMIETQVTPASSILETMDERPTTAEPDSCHERSDTMEKEESRKRKSATKKKRDAANSLKESLQQEIRQRESGDNRGRERERERERYSPQRRDRSRSNTYSPSPRRGRSRSRSWERSNWNYGRVRGRSRERDRGYDGWRYNDRGGYDGPRWRRYSRSPTRSRSRHRSSRSRSYSRDRDESRGRRSRSRSRERSRSRSRSESRDRDRERERERDRSPTPISDTQSTHGDDRERSCSPMPRSYARFRNRSSECREKKRREEKEKERVKEMETEKIKENQGGEQAMEIEEDIVPKGVPPPTLPHSIPLPLPPPPPPPSSLSISSAYSPSVPHSASTSPSPSIFNPPPPIVLPSKPAPLKICLLTKKARSSTSVISTSTSSSSSTSLTPHSSSSASSTPSNSATSLILDQVPLPSEPPPRSVERQDSGIVTKRTGVSSSSDMSVEGNTGKSDTSIGGGKGGTIPINRPTPPLSNPSADESHHSCGILPVLPPPPRPPPLDHATPPLDHQGTMENNGIPMSTTPTPLAATILKTTVCSANRSMPNGRQPLMGNGPPPHMQSMMYPQQYYPVGHINPYGPQQRWMNDDPSWQQHHNYYYGLGAPMAGGYGNPSGGMQHIPMPVPPPTVGPQPSLINAMGVMRTPNSSHTPQPVSMVDWGQAAREHAIMAHQHGHHGIAIPPPPSPMNQPQHMMGVPPAYGTPARGGGSGRFRGGGGKGRRW